MLNTNCLPAQAAREALQSPRVPPNTHAGDDAWHAVRIRYINSAAQAVRISTAMQALPQLDAYEPITFQDSLLWARRHMKTTSSVHRPCGPGYLSSTVLLCSSPATNNL